MTNPRDWGAESGKARTRKYRCSPPNAGGCRQRFTLRMTPQEFDRRPATWNAKQWKAIQEGTCPFCFKAKYYDVTRSVNKDTKKNTCDCGGMHYPHKRGTGNCIYNEGYDPWTAMYGPEDE